MPGGQVGIAGSVVAILLVLTFGWVGSPAEFPAVGWAVKELHRSYAPERPLWHDSPPLHNDFLMDDDILVEPKLGIRPWLSAQALEYSARQVLGPLAISEEKKSRKESLRWSS